MMTIENIDNKKICLSACSKYLIKILNNYYILTIGKANGRFIFMRIIYKYLGYENLFSFKDKNYNDIYKVLAQNNNPSYNFVNDRKNIILTYSLGSDEELISFILKENKKIKDVNISHNIKIQYNYNTKFLSDEKMINLSNTLFNKEDFENLCEIKMNATLLNFKNNDISDISPLKSENIKYLQNLDLSNNGIKNVDVFNELNLEDLIELILDQNEISDISPFENAKINNLQRLSLNNNNIKNIKTLENVNFNNLTKYLIIK